MPEPEVTDIAHEENVEIEPDQYLVFVVEGQEFGIQAMCVQEISTVVPVTGVPNTLPHIEGIINLRGRLATVLNFRKMFGFKERPHGEDTRIIIVEHDSFPIGVVVDSVEEVIKIPDDAVQKLPETTSVAIAEDYIRGVGMLDKRLIILLDIARIMDKNEMINADVIKQAIDSANSVAKTSSPEEPKTTTRAEPVENKPARTRRRKEG